MSRKLYIEPYVTCSICGHNYRGKIPKGGDGTVLFPRLHYRRVGERFSGKKEICPGSYREAKENE